MTRIWGFPFGIAVHCSGFSADTLIVDLNGGSDYTDIQSDIDAAAEAIRRSLNRRTA